MFVELLWSCVHHIKLFSHGRWNTFPFHSLGHLTPKTCYSHCTSPSILRIVNLSLSLHYRTLSISAAKPARPAEPRARTAWPLEALQLVSGESSPSFRLRPKRQTERSRLQSREGGRTTVWTAAKEGDGRETRAGGEGGSGWEVLPA